MVNFEVATGGAFSSDRRHFMESQPKTLMESNSKQANSPIPHVLLVFEKWCDLAPGAGISSSYENFAAPLEATGLATCTCFHVDEHYLRHREPGDRAILRLCEETHPDLVFIVWIAFDMSHINPSIETIHTIRQGMGIPVVTFCADSQLSHLMEHMDILKPYQDFICHGLSQRKSERNPQWYLHMPHPKDPALYCDPGVRRDIDVSFAGSVGNRPARHERLRFLQQAGLAVMKTGGQREDKLSAAQYADILKRSRIGLNICDFPERALNGRVMETVLCGALLFDDENSEADLWLKPGIEYIRYSDNHDLADKIRYYLSHESERAEIARRGHEAGRRHFDGRHFWATILDQVSHHSQYHEREGLLAFANYVANREDFDRARHLGVELIRRQPDYGPAHFFLGNLLLQIGKTADGIQALQRGATSPGFPAEGLALLVESLARDGQDDAAQKIALLLETTQSEAKDLETMISALRCHMALKQQHLALRKLKEAMDSHPAEARTFLYAAEFFLRAGETDSASQALAMATQRTEKPRQILKELADRLTLIGMNSFAESLKQTLQRPMPAHPSTIMHAGFSEELRGSFAEALHLFTFCNAQCPDGYLQWKIGQMARSIGTSEVLPMPPEHLCALPT